VKKKQQEICIVCGPELDSLLVREVRREREKILSDLPTHLYAIHGSTWSIFLPSIHLIMSANRLKP